MPMIIQTLSYFWKLWKESFQFKTILLLLLLLQSDSLVVGSTALWNNNTTRFMLFRLFCGLLGKCLSAYSQVYGYLLVVSSKSFMYFCIIHTFWIETERYQNNFQSCVLVYSVSSHPSDLCIYHWNVAELWQLNQFDGLLYRQSIDWDSENCFFFYSSRTTLKCVIWTIIV